MALGATFWFSTNESPPLVFVAVPFVVLVGWLLAFGYGRARFTLIMIAGFLAGMLAADFETSRNPTTLLDSEVTTRLRGAVVGRDIDHAGRWRYTVDIQKTWDPQIRRPPERVRLVSRSRHEPVAIGVGIEGLARLQPPSGPALPGEYDFSFNAYFKGIGAYGFFYGAPIVADSALQDGTVSSSRRLSIWLAQLREDIAARIRAVLPGDTGGFASALTVAERRAMSPETVEALRASGLAHVLAISGLHMALVAGTFFFFMRACFSFFPSLVQAVPAKKIAAAGALLVATFYLFISGGSVSTQRAWIMLAIVLVAVLLDRRALTMRNVAIAAIIIILISPSAVVGPGFQMSFAATAALIATYGLWDRRWSERRLFESNSAPGLFRVVLVFFAGLALTSLVAGLATAPFAIYHFHRVASFGLIANLLAMPIVTFVVMPAGLISLLVMPLGLEHWPLVAMGWGLDAVIAIARYVEGLGGVIVVGRMNWLALSALVSGFLVFVLAKTRLRLIGLAVCAIAIAAFVVVEPDRKPDLLVSEDGRLVALVTENGLATNRRRPSTFIFEQWQRSIVRDGHIAPTYSGVSATDLPSLFESMRGQKPSFVCVKDTYCGAVTAAGTRVAVVEDLAAIGAACDSADIVITAKKIAMERCYSGAMLVTGRMLRQSGSLEIGMPNKAGELLVRSAIGHTNRPWTEQRFYDWRSRSFHHNPPKWMRDQ
ncbi:ComEC/Rec2 family competence protein [Hoeflea sp. TYP-13]|uniref:ComEC/Rec2 family competence protein n=1 Tax=Hoeflea sp. TYP-13 TaxID=3230023 RepID=UPI0034C5EDD1